ncbi:hypothetical protein PG997_010885 [Apiospora hydei]|uniref:BTB domain-containing protein n=1 Tax=Apiospora hydei TaxID=1337664 RepID=A0ABR1VHJ2_9PEZI
MPGYDSIPKEPWGMMQRAGKEMFNNEFLSDAKVTVDDTTWPVHKSILCPRSEYFRKAFTGPFSEATTNQLTIEGQDAAAVGLVLYYLYTGIGRSHLTGSDTFQSCDANEVLMTVEDCLEISSIRGAVDFFVAADYFDIEHLKKESLDCVDEALEAVYELNRDRALLDDYEMDALFYTARLAYTSGPNLEIIREPIMRFIMGTDFLLIKDDCFMRELNNIPEFSLALMRLMASPENETKMLTCCRSMPKRCIECGLDRNSFAETSLIAHPEHYPRVRSALVGICDGCFNSQQ